ncbi:MAG: hypothetical protein IT534_03980 [Bauldia sp.]|jgi:hypothetical protein|nr:hypothetical protein [Bauldia sp.]
MSHGIRAAIAAASIVLTTGVALAQQAAAPEPLPRSGEFRLIYTFVNPEPFAPMPRAVDATGAVTQTAVVATNIAWLMNADGSGFGHQMTGRCANFQRLEGTTIVLNRGNCVYTDRDGDMLFEEFGRDAGDTVTTGHWIGGTGKYAGVQATFTITGLAGFGGRTEGAPIAGAVAGLNELYTLSSGIKTGTYTLPPL